MSDITWLNGWPIDGPAGSAAVDLPSGKTVAVRFWIDGETICASALDLETGLNVMPHFLATTDREVLERAVERLRDKALAKVILDCGTMH